MPISSTKDSMLKNPICNMRAESEEIQQYKIVNFKLLIPEDDKIDNLADKSGIYLFLESKLGDKNIILPLSEKMIKYLINHYSIYEIDDIVGLDVKFKVYSDTEIIFDEEYIFEIDIVENYIVVDKNTNEKYKNIYLSDLMRNCLERKKNLIHNHNIQGSCIVKNVKTIKTENKYITTLCVENTDTKYATEFELEYPIFYDENNKVINFINENGYGSVEGLENEQIYVDFASKHSDNDIIVQDNDVAIINKTEDDNKNPYSRLIQFFILFFIINTTIVTSFFISVFITKSYTIYIISLMTLLYYVISTFIMVLVTLAIRKI